MARIRILQAVGGVDFSWAPGDEVEVDDEQAAMWADGERAELVEVAATKSRGGGRGRRAETRTE